jgi:hypothetical protein
MSKLISIIIILFCFSTHSQTTITGDISGLTFKPSGNPWVVKENIFIEEGSKTVIKPGCVFLFKPFSGIIVQGSIEVEGQPEAPVVFTSINDSSYNEASTQKAEPFDWNGIAIEKTAENVKLSDFVLSFSVYGLKSKKEDVILERGIFRQNGQFHFTINDKIQEVESNLPFSYNIAKKTEKIAKTPSRGWARPVGIGTIVTGTAFLGVMGYFIYSGADLNEKYNNTGNPDDVARYSSKRDKAVQNALITGIVGGLLVPVGTGFLIWEHKTRNGGKDIAFYPVAGTSNGFQLVMKF